jgi:hypothetical protein
MIWAQRYKKIAKYARNQVENSAKLFLQYNFSMLYPMLEVRMGYSWDIRGIFTEYSWSIRMYRVCIGYVSGMYRECIERNRVRVGSSNFMQDNLHNEYIINNLNNIYFSTTCAPINFLGRFKEIS